MAKTLSRGLLPAALMVLIALAPLSPAGAGVLSGSAPDDRAESGIFAWLADLLQELGFAGGAAELEEVAPPPPADSLPDVLDVGGGLGSNSGPGLDPNGAPSG